MDCRLNCLLSSFYVPYSPLDGLYALTFFFKSSLEKLRNLPHVLHCSLISTPTRTTCHHCPPQACAFLSCKVSPLLNTLSTFALFLLSFYSHKIFVTANSTSSVSPANTSALPSANFSKGILFSSLLKSDACNTLRFHLPPPSTSIQLT